jgi:DNA primase large subunit
MDKLSFSQKFPFSENAREYLKEMDVKMDNLPEPALKRAALMVSRAFSGSVYILDQENPSKEQLELELVAFPIAKMFVSLMSTPNMNEKFCAMVQKMVFERIVGDKDPKGLIQILLDDFKINYSISSEKNFFLELPLLEYVGIYFTDQESKLLNKNVRKGVVYLNLNDSARFLAEKSYAKVFDSLPIDSKQIPKTLHPLAKSIESQLGVIEKKKFDLKLAGKIDPNLFPPCMRVLYEDQLAGKKLPYMARLAVASFLFQLGMQKTEMMTLLAKSPDFKPHIAQYHVDRIFEKELSAPGCRKMEEYGLKVAECNKVCTYKHPLQYYIAKLRIKNRIANKKEQKVIE